MLVCGSQVQVIKFKIVRNEMQTLSTTFYVLPSEVIYANIIGMHIYLALYNMSQATIDI